jgi:hypothetical protein
MFCFLYNYSFILIKNFFQIVEIYTKNNNYCKRNKNKCVQEERKIIQVIQSWLYLLVKQE